MANLFIKPGIATVQATMLNGEKVSIATIFPCDNLAGLEEFNEMQLDDYVEVKHVDRIIELPKNTFDGAKSIVIVARDELDCDFDIPIIYKHFEKIRVKERASELLEIFKTAATFGVTDETAKKPNIGRRALEKAHCLWSYTQSL